jgi:cbb3-type cytochrome oxidase maturation protein
MALLTIWVLYAVIGMVLLSVIFLWAVRSGQFRDQQRARYLPLESPPQDDKGVESASSDEGSS